MTDLDKARQRINEIDRQMASLFEKRMDAVKRVASYKKEHGIPVDDFL
ncbi:MAG: chorismate mutase, partial [Clostridia bacterium]|nr:chorismate mutase [Clostridia bacterium]